MSGENTLPKRIEGSAKTVRELLDKGRYTIDFYQREYAWQEKQVYELIDDLTGKFLDFYDPDHAREDVEDYGHYFLGSIVISHKRSLKYIVDGQQRLTTLTLLLIYLQNLQVGRDQKVDVDTLIFSEKFGRKNFNLDVPERTGVMDALLRGDDFDSQGANESVLNIAQRYRDICAYFPEEVTGRALPYFIDWLLENVHLVQIEAYSDDDAYTIFETMNDRGLSLSLPEMLKGYVLANIREEADQKAVNDLWKKCVQEFKEVGSEEDVNFFKNWLRGRYADSIRAKTRGAENKDFERIGSEFHRWVRDHRERLGLADSTSFLNFVQSEMAFFARKALLIRQASKSVVDGLEAIYYNASRAFTLQDHLILAALDRRASEAENKKRMALVADFLDIWLSRRVWNFRTTAYASIKNQIFGYTREVRGRSLESLATYLREQLDKQTEDFANQPNFRLHGNNYAQHKHILARITHWVDSESGLVSHLPDLLAEGRARPFEIEHIWANHYDRFRHIFDHQSDFESTRNRIGGLLMLQRGLNQSLGDATYEEKQEAYVTKGENLLARSLHPASYTNNPGFKALIARTGLPFKPYATFGPEELRERSELYIRIAEWIWNPTRLDLDGIKPPIPKSIAEYVDDEHDDLDRPDRDDVRLKFWTDLLAYSHEHSELHRRISPGKFHWVGTSQKGIWWNYALLSDSSRVELYIDRSNQSENKAIYDALAAQKTEIEVAFGAPLVWQRLDEKRACRISFHLEGGWADQTTWEALIPKAVDMMERLHRALEPRLGANGHL